MAETETSEATAPPEHDGNLDERVSRIERVVEQIKDAVIPGSHAEAERRTEARLDRASTTEDMVRAELDRRDREAAEKRAKEDEQRRGEDHEERLARLEEKPPASPRLRRTPWLGWGDGRA